MAPNSPVIFTRVPPLFVGSYRRVGVRIDPASKIVFDDLAFEVTPDDGSSFSPSRDALFDPKRPNVMVLAGSVLGSHELLAKVAATGLVVGRTMFTVTNRWANRLRSPSAWIGGVHPRRGPQPTWGGGSTVGPENLPTTPVVGRRKIVVVFVDTTSARYPTTGTTLADAQRRWRENVLDGVLGGDGISRSVAAYYREVSYFDGTPNIGLDIDAFILPNVVSLTTSWAANFSTDSQGRWQAVNTFCNSVIAAGGVANFAGADMVVCVVQPVTATAGNKVAWPYGGYSATGSSGPPANINVNARGVVMPNTWGDGSALDQGGGRTVFETVTHELGHTINLGDAYSPVVTGRNVGQIGTNVSWDPMDWEDPWPHFSAVHRLTLGWIDPAWVKCFNFQALGTLVDEEIVLTPVERGAPFPNAYLAVEVRVANGRNYYFEYRCGQVNQIGDELLTPNGRILGTDVAAASTTRPDILLLEKHADDNGAVLYVGEHYHEVDATTPTYPVDFRLDVVSITPDMARVRVRYEPAGKPDPMIRPWPRDAAHPWQSPDVEISNAKCAANPVFTNVPWNGHPNTVTARVANGGTLSAPGVTARFFWKDYTIGGAPETFIGADTHDIAPGATVPFSVNWVPQPPTDPNKQQHYCIVVRIDPYAAPTVPPIPEADPGNNLAQSNYAQFISASSSPPSREITRVTVSNPYDAATRFFIRSAQSNPKFRTYVEHTCLTLGPGESRTIDVMFEHAPETLRPDAMSPQDWDRAHGLPNDVSIVGLIEDPHDPHLHGPSLVSGLDARVLRARATRFDELGIDGPVVVGLVVVVDDGSPVSGGSVVVVTIRKGDADLRYTTTAVDGDGRFFAKVGDEIFEATAHYVPSAEYGECSSETRHVG